MGPHRRPHDIGVATVIYSLVTFVCMALFGVEEWIERGETFSAYFGMFSRLAPFEARGRELGIRKFLTGAPQWAAVPGAAALVLVSIAVTSFDGAQEGALSGAIRWTFERCSDIGFSLPDSFRVANTIWLLIVFAGVSLLYWLGVKGMHTVRGSPPVKDLARSFAHTLIPIALAYLVAHYFSAFLYQEQAQFTYILSDPLGHGSDLFGTAGAESTTGSSLEHRLVRAGRRPRDRPRHRPDPGARPGARRLRQRPARLALAVLHARGDGRLHLLRAVPALPGERVITRLSG